MKPLNSFREFLLVLALLLATNALAINKGSLHISMPERVAEQLLPPGDYSVQWDEAGADLELKIMQGRRLIASTPAKLVVLKKASYNDSAVILSNDDGSGRLWRIYFLGRKYALEIVGDFKAPNVQDGN